MSDTSDLITRLRAGLMDTSAVIWGTAEVEEALRQALADMCQASGEFYTLSGLDGAISTTLPGVYFALLVRGGLAYALLSRAAERVDAFNYQANLSADALAVSAAAMQRFEAGLTALGLLRLSTMQTTPNAPFPDGTDANQNGWQLPDNLSAAGGD